MISRQAARSRLKSQSTALKSLSKSLSVATRVSPFNNANGHSFSYLDSVAKLVPLIVITELRVLCDLSANVVGTTPHGPPAAPCRGERGYFLAHLYAERSQQDCSWAERGAGWAGYVHRDQISSRKPGRQAVRQLAGCWTGWADAWAGPYRPTCARKKERKGRREPPASTAVCDGVACAGLKSKGPSTGTEIVDGAN